MTVLYSTAVRDREKESSAPCAEAEEILPYTPIRAG